VYAASSRMMTSPPVPFVLPKSRVQCPVISVVRLGSMRCFRGEGVTFGSVSVEEAREYMPKHKRSEHALRSKTCASLGQVQRQLGSFGWCRCIHSMAGVAIQKFQLGLYI